MFKKSKTVQEPFYDILDSTASFELREAYNSLCTNVLHASNDGILKKFVVTSSVYGEGKTALAINLATALACNLMDKKILLVDADLRTPRVADFLKDKVAESTSVHGLSEYLSAKSNSLPVIKTSIDNFDVVFSGSVSLNPAGLLNSLTMKEFLDKCSETYDYIIIDAPPISVVSDALFLTGSVDGYIIAALTKLSKIPMLDATQEALKSVGAKILGVVLTELEHKK